MDKKNSVDINGINNFTVMFSKDTSVGTKYVPAFTEVSHLGSLAHLQENTNIVYLEYTSLTNEKVVVKDDRESCAAQIEEAQNKLMQESMDAENQTAPADDEGNDSQPATDDTGNPDTAEKPPAAAEENRGEPTAAEKKTGKWPFGGAKKTK